MMRRTFEQENLYTLSKHSEEFKNKVRVLIESDDERSTFYTALKSYIETESLDKLVADLKLVINTPKRHPLFKEVRHLIRPLHVAPYLKLIPRSTSEGIHFIKLKRSMADEIGFSIRGGREHNVGIFVSLVTRGSQADIVGLKVGDEILAINSLILQQATHDEVVNLLKNRRNILLKVKSSGKVPCKIHDVLTWESVEDKENVYYHPDLLEHLVKEGDFSNQTPFKMKPDDKQISLVVGPKGMGCSVRNGIPGKNGLFVISINPGSLADKTGVRIGDQVVAVNGKNIMKMRYSEAIYLLRAHQDLVIVLRHSKEAERFINQEESKNKIETVPEFAIKTQLLLKKAEEKERKDKAEKEKERQRINSGEESKEEDGGGEILPESSSDKSVGDGDSTPNGMKKAMFTEVVQVHANRSEQEIEDAFLVKESLNPSNVDFEPGVLGDREARFLSIEKVLDLGMDVEERDNGIFVKEITSGCISEHGGISVGDQILNVEGTSLLGVSAEEARQELTKAMKRKSEALDLVVAISPKSERQQTFLRIGSVVRRKDKGTGEEVYDTWL